MAPIFPEVVLTWGGEEFRVTPTMSLLNKIEQQGVSLSSIILRSAEGNPPISHIATAIYHFLLSAGAKVKWEDVYSEISQFNGLEEAVNAIGLAAFPRAGKAAAPASTTTKRPTGASTTTSRRRRGA